MRSFLSLVIGVPVMVGLWFFAHWLVASHEVFAEGFVAGIFAILVLLWVIWRLNPAAFFSEKDRERLKAQLLDQAIRERHGE